MVSLTVETSADLHLLEKGDVIVCIPTQVIGWMTLLCVKALTARCCSGISFHEGGGKEKMFRIWDEIQMVRGEVGPTYEVVISRTRYVDGCL